MQDGEETLYFAKCVDSVLYRSLPEVHGAGSLPGVHTIHLMVTDRRVVVWGAVFERLKAAEFSLWYPGKPARDNCDVLEGIALRDSRLGGQHLELTGRARVHGPLRSDVAQLCLYMDEPERVARIPNERLARERRVHLT